MRSAGKEAVELANLAGLQLDDWQKYVLESAMGIREDDLWAANEVGLVVPRQCGKGSIIEARELWGLYVGNEQILHTAHLFKTALEGFNRIWGLIQSTPELKQEVSRVVRNHGEEGIQLKSGARLHFGTRNKGAGRGLTLDTVINDEAMMGLGPSEVSAIMPTVSARPNPQIWNLGSAGTKDSLHFGSVRHRGVKASDPRLCFLEWSIDGCDDFCPPECTDHDPIDTVESYAKSNPALGIRVSLEHVESERRSLPREEFARERLGVGTWPVQGNAWHVISEEAWEACCVGNDESGIEGMVSLALDVTPDRQYACLAVAGLNDEGFTHVEIPANGAQYDHVAGTRWIVDRMQELVDRWRPVSVVVDPSYQGGMFVAELEARGITVTLPKARDYAQACGAFYSAVVPRRGDGHTLVHPDQAPLSTAVAGAEKRERSGLWVWDRQSRFTDISPLVAATLAMWGLHKKINEPDKKVIPKVAWG